MTEEVDQTYTEPQVLAEVEIVNSEKDSAVPQLFWTVDMLMCCLNQVGLTFDQLLRC
jgi:hypothetical protein